jgi:hypothetical protein
MRFGRGGSLSLVEGALERCRYSFQSAGDQLRLVVHCKECDGKGDLLESKCRNRVIEILLEEPVPSSIVLSGFVETLYEDNVVLLIQQMTDILRSVKQFGRRCTVSDADGCARCKKSPRYVFRKIETAFRKSLPTFHREIRIQSSGLSSNRDSCRTCLESTNSDLQTLLNDVENLKSFILRHAFKISNTAVRR